MDCSMDSFERQIRIRKIKCIIDEYYDALAMAKAGKSYQIGNRNLVRLTPAEILDAIKRLETELAKLETGIGSRCFVTPRRMR